MLRRLSDELAALGLDLESTLRDEPRFLLDPAFLGAVHTELEDRLSPEEKLGALFQLGFLHGLRDAALVLRAGFGQRTAMLGGAPCAPRLAIHASPTAGTAVAVAGGWPERREADAILDAGGAAEQTSCAVSSGYTSGWLSGIYDTEMLALEQTCCAAGHPACHFEAREAENWAENDHPWAALALALPFGALRELVARQLDDAEPMPEEPEQFEAGSPVVHVWGPVMVLPFSGPEESMRALELIARDPGARGVRVVVIDLSGTLIDPGFGAAALERVIDAVEGWGAEPVLAGVSPLSAPVVADLEQTHLVLQKDLPEAIAVAFQVADAQRQLI